MSDTSQAPVRSTFLTTSPPFGAPPQDPDRLYPVAAWVAIIAGILVAIATTAFCVFALWCL